MSFLLLTILDVVFICLPGVEGRAFPAGAQGTQDPTGVRPPCVAAPPDGRGSEALTAREQRAGCRGPAPDCAAPARCLLQRGRGTTHLAGPAACSGPLCVCVRVCARVCECVSGGRGPGVWRGLVFPRGFHGGETYFPGAGSRAERPTLGPLSSARGRRGVNSEETVVSLRTWRSECGGACAQPPASLLPAHPPPPAGASAPGDPEDRPSA